MAKKYIDAELLRKEIESRMENCDVNSKNPNQLLWAELAAILPLIDTLQQEQPTEELEEAAEAGARQFYVAGGYSPFPNIECGAYKNGFIAGAEWQKEQILQLAKNRYEMAMTFVSGNPDVDQAIQLDRLGLVTIIQKKESR